MKTWNTTFSKEDLEVGWDGIFPLELAKKVIKTFSKENETVLDPFCGTGTTLVAAKELHRKGVGIDLSQKIIDIAKTRGVNPKVGSVFSLSELVTKDSIDLVFTSPPYWTHLTKYTDYIPQKDEDVGKIQSYTSFLHDLKRAFSQVFLVLKQGGKCAVLVTDLSDDKVRALPTDLIKILTEIGLKYQETIVWDKRTEISRKLKRELSEIPESLNEKILVFSKELI
ncbi:MAG: methyltransferase domain-containing protein [Candidatus Altiarchaeota archaeon]|nr:methyltransferase domain-containing protein [Candidatus Altiarchaeota archaeon]